MGRSSGVLCQAHEERLQAYEEFVRQLSEEQVRVSERYAAVQADLGEVKETTTKVLHVVHGLADGFAELKAAEAARKHRRKRWIRLAWASVAAAVTACAAAFGEHVWAFIRTIGGR